MLSVRALLAIFGVLPLGLAAIAAVHLAASSAYANGRVVEFDRRIAGPYEIALGKIPPSPVVGNFYLSILLTDTQTKMPVIGANVVVSAIGPVGEDGAAGTVIGPIVVNPDPDPQNYPGYYDTEQPIVLDKPGAWLFTVSVDGAAGAPTDTAAAEFPVDVTTPNPITGIITLVALVAFIVVVALAIRMYIRERRRSKSS